MQLIPALDIIDGQCVRLTQGDYGRQTTYSGSPVAIARGFEEAGAERLHLVDLDGAKGGGIVNHQVLADIKAGTGLTVDFGGGIKGDRDIQCAFDQGADQVTVGSVAVKEPERALAWLAYYGGEALILGADLRGRKVATSGWKEESDTDVYEFLEYYGRAGMKCCICTDIARDGMLEGPALELYADLLRAFPHLQLIASGGVGNLDHLRQLNETGVHGVIIGKALHEGRFTFEEAMALVH